MNDTMIVEAMKSSGPVAGLVIILAFLIRTWMATQLKTIESLIAEVKTLVAADAALKVELVEVRAEMREQGRRIVALEARKGPA